VNLLRHLEFFVAVATRRHFGEAAADLGMTQPPLSQGIRRLEQHWGATLFDRSSQGVELTEVGEQLLPLARRLLSEARTIDVLVRDLTHHEPSLRVGLCTGLESAGAAVVAAVRSSLGREVEPVEAASVDLVDRVRRGALDVAVVRHPGVVDGTAAGEVVRVPQRLLVPADAPDALALIRIPVVTEPRQHHPPAHDQLVDTLRRHGHSGDVVTEVSAATATALIAAGRACRLTTDRITPPGTRLVDLPDALAVVRLRALSPSAAHRRAPVVGLRECVEQALA
jgi:DNA-binding transcriptional LysR family regulator